MALFQQENGYVKAGFAPRPIGAMEWAKGDLAAAFKEPVKKVAPELKQAPKVDKQAAAAEAKAEAPRTQSPQKAEPVQAQPKTNAQEPVKAAPAQQAEGNEPTHKTQEPLSVAAAVQAQEPGAKTAEPAIDSTAKPGTHDAAKAFRVGMVDDGSEAANVRRYHTDMKKFIDNNHTGDEGKKVRNAMMQQAILDQQRQAFMQSQEYATAMALTDQQLEEYYEQRDTLKAELDELQQTHQQQTQRVEEAQTTVTVLEERQQDLEDLKDQKDAHEIDASAYYAAKAEFAQYEDKINAMPSMQTVMHGDNIYLQSEDGMSFYKIDQDGNTVKVNEMEEFPHGCPASFKTFMRKADDGSIEYVNERGDVLSQQQTEQMNAHLAAQGKKPEDVMADYNEYKAAMEDPARVAAEEKYTQTLDKAAESEVALWNEAERLGISITQLDTIDSYIENNQKELENARAELKAAQDAKSLTEEQIAEKEEEIKMLEERIKQTEEFKQKLANGEFENEEQMIRAMPPRLKEEYESCMTGKAPSAEASALCLAPTMGEKDLKGLSASLKGVVATATENTTRINGSATDSGIKASADVNTQFASASKGEQPANTDTPTPATPAAPAQYQQNQQMSAVMAP